MTNSRIEEIDFDYATFVAERAVGLMSRLKIAPTPANYAIWFDYCQGSSPDLKQSIDKLFDSKARFDGSTNAALIANFGRGGPAAGIPDDIPKRLGSVMKDAQGLLQNAIADNRTQMLAIGKVASEVGTESDPRDIIEALVVELSNSVNRASKLEMNFVEANRELSEIRVCLDQAEQRAKTDALTGLPNRLALEEFFRDAQIAAVKNNHPLSILMIDVDHFKRFNDEFGHGVGDQVLRLIAKVLRDGVTERDLPARYGGEELIAVLPASDLQTCAVVGERIRRAISECKITRRSTGTLLPGITVSVGAAQMRPGESMVELIERCDQALYKAKDAGRDRLVTEAA